MDMTMQRASSASVPKPESGLDHIESRLQEVSEKMARAVDKLRSKSAPVSLQLPIGAEKTCGSSRSLAPAFIRLGDAISTLDGYVDQIESITLGLDI